MKQRTINVVCLLLAVGGISFGIGQSVGQDRAQADAQAARTQVVKDNLTRRYTRATAFWAADTYGALIGG